MPSSEQIRHSIAGPDGQVEPGDPEKGHSGLAAGLRAAERDAVEDLLRALLECEHRSQPASATQLADQLGLELAPVEAVLLHAQELGAISTDGQHWQLTPQGRETAVRVMRAHRLVETRLARESGLGAEQWHEVAHTVEHRLSREEVNRLADRLSNPRFDPHGDPIPTREGRLPEPEGEPLLAWESDRPVVITHIEDEPPALFARLAALGVFAGERVILRASSPQGCRLEIEGHEVLLPVDLAGLVRVRPLRGHEMPAPSGARRLSDLEPGGAARVLTLLPGCIGGERARLLDLGFVPGSRIEYALRSPLGGSAAYRVRGTLIALRRRQAEQVLIEPIGT
jgi:DtxR family transcriptional regulator, Mn-dependent transcriptional regulator